MYVLKNTDQTIINEANNLEFIVKPQTRYENKKGEQRTMFILDFSGDLYGQAVRVELHSFWRHTQRYENTEALRNMINEAADAARAYFAEKPTSDLWPLTSDF